MSSSDSMRRGVPLRFPCMRTVGGVGIDVHPSPFLGLHGRISPSVVAAVTTVTKHPRIQRDITGRLSTNGGSRAGGIMSDLLRERQVGNSPL